MKRRFLKFAAATSLVLLLISIAQWVRSYPNWELFAHRGHLFLVLLEADQGANYLRWQRRLDETSAERGARFWRLAHEVTQDNAKGARRWRGGMGFGTGRAYLAYAVNNSFANGISSWFRLAAVPFWFVAAVLAILPAVCALHWRRQRHRATHGLCATCGYDIHATPECCPECGVVPGPRRTSAA